MSQLEQRRERVATAWNLDDTIVLVGSGGLVPIAGTDQFYPFLCHPEYRYLAGRDDLAAVLAFDPAEGWTRFEKPVTIDDEVWEGARPPKGPTTDDLKAWLKARNGKDIAVLGGPGPFAPEDTAPAEELRRTLDELRRTKDGDELDAMRRAAAATAHGFAAAAAAVRPGATERDVHADLEHAMARAGADRTAFCSTVASGPNAAALHFAPTERAFREGEFVLVDAGASVDGYAADVTRTFCAGALAGFRRDLYEVVLAAQTAAVARCGPGKEYREIHLACAVDLAAGLVDLGVLRGRAEDLVARNAHALFFTHGLGHLLGLCAHDPAGYLEGRERSTEFGLKFLRTDLPLQPGYVVTIEPGLYFVPAVLRDPERRETYRDDVDWDRVDGLLDVGGVRIEDDVHVTADGHEVLTAAIPKTISTP